MSQHAWSDGSTAWLSGCERYRYSLGRNWGEGWRAPVTFVMLNPSTADANQDDPTIRRCIGFAKAWDFSRLVVVNLYALRSTDPKGLWRVADPVGPNNDEHLADAAFVAHRNNAPIIAAWGANAKFDRVDQVLALPHMDRLMSLGETKTGAPRHPLYLKADAFPIRWSQR